VTVWTTFAGERYEWKGRIVRTEGEIDPTTRMVHAVVEVKDPYAPGDDPTRPPLKAGMFVEAEIEGNVVENVVALPRAALRPQGIVWLVDGDQRLRYREVEVLRTTETEVLVEGGLAEGELVCLSPLDAATDGMKVRVAPETEETSL
jgi:multidrug efflux pump subunit AcrA (membrane-fusion protein)